MIDAGGRVLMPGLIDAHWHVTYAYTPASILLLNQGDMPEVAIRSMTGVMETLQLMKDKGAWLCPQPMFEDDMVWADPISAAKYKQVTDAVSGLYPLAKKVGVNIAFGTDQLMDASKAQQQSDYLVRLGTWFSPYEALKIATSENARLLELSGPRHPYQEGPLGVVQEGAYADLILVDGNPLEDLELVGDPGQNFVLIMKDGKVYKNTLD